MFIKAMSATLGVVLALVVVAAVAIGGVFLLLMQSVTPL